MKQARAVHKAASELNWALTMAQPNGRDYTPEGLAAVVALRDRWRAVAHVILEHFEGVLAHLRREEATPEPIIPEGKRRRLENLSALRTYYIGCLDSSWDAFKRQQLDIQREPNIRILDTWMQGHVELQSKLAGTDALIAQAQAEES